MKTTSRKKRWSPKAAEEYYGFGRWGGDHFTVDEQGMVNAHPMADSRAVCLMDIVREAAEMGLKPPLTIRLQDLLRKRVEEINKAFFDAIESENYAGRYRGVFPIKVNQMREVVEEIFDAGKPYQFGLEAGSKPELMIAMSLAEDIGSLVICNGYKDEDYIQLALMGTRLGKEVIIVVEQPSEIDTILKASAAMDVKPCIGLRLKLMVHGEGKWAESSGENAKFGLSAPEVLCAANKLKNAGMSDCLKLLHFHIGSQVPSILPIKKAVAEAARYYCELTRMGFPLQYLDVGGGLGIDYDGSRTNFESSMNYSMREYARDVVFGLKSVCSQAGITPPDIVSESGRAIVAPHSVLIVEVTDRISKFDDESTLSSISGPVDEHAIIKELRSILKDEGDYSQLERFHDAQQRKDEAASLFSLGYLTLEARSKAEALYWAISRDVTEKIREREGYLPEEFDEMQARLADQYVCNFSVFQSLLDHWALKQLFPIAPIHRLDEEPSVNATLVDITCDSDGKISQFTDLEDVKKSLRLHPIKEGEPYYLGVFLVGAYQDIMGDLHNLFGRVNEVHVFLEDDAEGGFYIEESISGLSIQEVLNFIQYKGALLSRGIKRQIDAATRDDRVKPREGVRLMSLYKRLMEEKTYLKVGIDPHETPAAK